MAAALFAAALLPVLAKAEDDGFDEVLDDDAHLVDELLADEQDELKPTVVDLSNQTWKEFVSFPCRWTGPPSRCCASLSRPRLIPEFSRCRDAD